MGPPGLVIDAALAAVIRGTKDWQRRNRPVFI